MKSKFKVKIIGGKLVHVPDYDYVKEYGNSHMKQLARQSNFPEKNGRLSQMNQKQISRYPVAYIDPHVPQSRDDYAMHSQLSYNGRDILFDPVALDESKLSFCVRNSRGNTLEANHTLDQRVANHFEAERNKRKVQQQLYSSSLEFGPIPTETSDINNNSDEDNVREAENDDAALSEQIADCLQNTNKQKLAYALRAMKRLDLAGNGYITTREFRDVLLMHQIFIIGGTLEKLIEKYRSNGGRINYTRLWSFVSNSYRMLHDSAHSKLPLSEETDEERVLREAKANIQKSLRAYAQEHLRSYDFTNISTSFQHCDRTKTNLMHENEMRIICKHYLPLDAKDLNALFKYCDPQCNGWINYQSFLGILKDAQPTYLPPIKPIRRGTFTIDEESPAVLLPDLDGERSRRVMENRGKAPNRKGEESIESGDQRESPRRKWYENDEPVNDRKQRDIIHVKKRKPVRRKKWENSDPFRNPGNARPHDSPLPRDPGDSGDGFHHTER